jgi:glucan biosynthesis protein C
MTAEPGTSGRQHYFDGVRFLMMVGVVLFHATMAYSNHAQWWPVTESQRSVALNVLLSILDVYMMPVMFFVAGVFAVPSMKRHGPGNFMIGKLGRLGIPLVLITVFSNPIASYVRHVRMHEAPMGLFEFWLGQLRTAGDMSITFLAGRSTEVKYIDHISQWHMWFISLLILFFALYSVTHIPVLKKLRTPSVDNAPGSRRILLTMMVFGLVTALLVSIFSMYTVPRTWVRIGPLFVFQLTRAPIYLGLFALGAYAYSRRWFEDRTLPGVCWIWGLAATLLFVANLGFIAAMMNHPEMPRWFGSVMNGILRSFTGLAFTGFFITLCHRFLNRPSAVLGSLGDATYDIYLIHLPIVIGLQYLLQSLSISVYLKTLVVFVIAFTACWGLSRRLIKPHPRIAVGVLIASFGGLCLILT